MAVGIFFLMYSIWGTRRRQGMALLLCSTLSLAACGGGSGSGPSSGGSQSSIPVANTAPTIAGNPSTTVQANSPYEFVPTAIDADGDPLRFAIQGKPSWAAFDTGTGRLYGTPPAGTGGTFVNIQISVTDGKATSALPNFSIAVVATAPVPAPATGSAELSWSKPTQNVDGTALTDLAGYRIYYGESSGSLAQRFEITNPDAQTAVINNLTVGRTWYFAMSAYTIGGVESARTQVVSKTI